MKRISELTVARLSLYMRLLSELDDSGVETLSSGELARLADTTAAQVRKDLSSFGTFGKRGLGYAVPDLLGALRTILGLERRWRVALVGAGRMGSALCGYPDFRRQGFYIEAVFDADPAKVGQEREGLRVRCSESLERYLMRGRTDIVIVAVPAESAQGVVDRVVAGGVRAILNFAPTKLRVPAGVALKNVNMAMELEGLSYALASASAAARGGDRVA